MAETMMVMVDNGCRVTDAAAAASADAADAAA